MAMKPWDPGSKDITLPGIRRSSSMGQESDPQDPHQPRAPRNRHFRTLVPADKHSLQLEAHTAQFVTKPKANLTHDHQSYQKQEVQRPAHAGSYLRGQRGRGDVHLPQPGGRRDDLPGPGPHGGQKQ